MKVTGKFLQPDSIHQRRFQQRKDLATDCQQISRRKAQDHSVQKCEPPTNLHRAAIAARFSTAAVSTSLLREFLNMMCITKTGEPSAAVAIQFNGTRITEQEAQHFVFTATMESSR